MDCPPRRVALKVSDFRRYHLSGNRDTTSKIAETFRKLQSPRGGSHLHSGLDLESHPQPASPVLKHTRDNTTGTSCYNAHTHQLLEPQLECIHTSVGDITDNSQNKQTGAVHHHSDSHASGHNFQTSMEGIDTQRDNMSEREQQLLKQLEEEKPASQKLQQQLNEAKIEAEIKAEKQRQAQWAEALAKVKEVQENSLKEKEKHMGAIEKLLEQTLKTKDTNPDTAITTLLKGLLTNQGETPEEQERREKQEQERQKNRELADRLMAQQKALMEQVETLRKQNIDEETKALLSAIQPEASITQDPHRQADQLMAQLRQALGQKDPEDINRSIIKQFLTRDNTTPSMGGTTTLKPQLLKQLTGEEEDFNMAEWLSMFNKQEQGESRSDIEDESKQKSSKSGILDRATSNMQHKEVWPQKNLLKDWADEEVSFNQLQFEQYVAREV